MRRRTALFVLLFAVVTSLVPGAISTRAAFVPMPPHGLPTSTLIASDGLYLYGFSFDLYSEIPWQMYKPTMTVYILSGKFTFYGTNDNSKVVISPPQGGDCIHIRTRVFHQKTDKGIEYLYPEDQDKGCLPTASGDCKWPMQVCDLTGVTSGDDSVLLEQGTVLYIPAGTECYICAIETASSIEPALLDVTMSEEGAKEVPSWVDPLVEEATSEASPAADRTSGGNALRILHIPLLNPGGCAGRIP
jgi:hypothetical protein